MIAVVDEPIADQRHRRVQDFIEVHRACPQSVSLRIGAAATRHAAAPRVLELDAGIPRQRGEHLAGSLS